MKMMKQKYHKFSLKKMDKIQKLNMFLVISIRFLFNFAVYSSHVLVFQIRMFKVYN